MSDKHKGMVNDHGRSVAREKMVPVAEGSQQGKPPGSGAGADTGNMQSGAAGLGGRQGGEDAGTRGGPGSQLRGRSARQQGQRIQERAEQDRLGMSQQSGYGGLQESQHGGSEASATAPASRQSGESGPGGRGHPEQPGSDYGSSGGKGKGS
jgi:hypothetical protein